MKQLKILHQDRHIVAVQKPAKMHVHPPEDARHVIRDDDNCLKVLSRQLGAYLYPVHRLDRPTSGVLIFALDAPSAAALCRQFEERRVQKTYAVMARGWLASDTLEVHRPLTSSGPSATSFQQLARWTAPWACSRFKQSRYSLLLASPHTGRLHQIRRHLAGIGHPVIGDTQRGDGEHNRLIRHHWNIQRLWLHALAIQLEHPSGSGPLKIRAPFPADWHQAFDVFGICPFTR